MEVKTFTELFFELEGEFQKKGSYTVELRKHGRLVTRKASPIDQLDMLAWLPAELWDMSFRFNTVTKRHFQFLRTMGLPVKTEINSVDGKYSMVINPRNG